MNKQVFLKEQDKKDFTKIILQVTCKKPHIKNFSEDDPWLPKVQEPLINKLSK